MKNEDEESQVDSLKEEASNAEATGTSDGNLGFKD